MTVKRNIVDYVTGSTGVLTNMNEFFISNFDSMFSDIHCPISCDLRISLDISTAYPITQNQTSLKFVTPHTTER